ncbi:DUF3387 domain-containing protein, partial [bacterium]
LSLPFFSQQIGSFTWLYLKIDYKEYEKKIQKLLDNHISSDEIMKITELVNIFDKDKFEEEVSKLKTPSSRADTIASRTIAVCRQKMDEDPVFYAKFSKLLEVAIEAHKNQRISDVEYLNNVNEAMESVRNRTADDIPVKIKHLDVARAFYGITLQVLNRNPVDNLDLKDISADAAIRIDEIIQRNLVVDWFQKDDVKNNMRNQIDDYLYSVKGRYNIPISNDDIDLIIEQSLPVAKIRYNR